MKNFYIETDKIISSNKVLRYFYKENENGDITFVKMIDMITKEEVTRKELIDKGETSLLIIIETSPQRFVSKIYFEN